MQTLALPPPATPSHSRLHYSPTAHTCPPMQSSPLASPSGSSPSTEAQSRRRAQFKANGFSSPAARPNRLSSAYQARRGASGKLSGATGEEPPRKAFLRERLKARAVERAVQKRERALVRRSRHLSSEPSSDGMDEMMDEDEDEMLNDEFYHRIMDNSKRKQVHAYRLSYSLDVGSSFDPDMEDPQSWEDDLHALNAISTGPEDLDEEEIAAYAAEAELNLDDLAADDIFGLSDFEDAHDRDVDMH
ncbi:uncharacterized protein BXZ73DRAFT_88458 [Epithele typhae]|uniref:uncharacterized protein n=1 Tax=Epithele typhae TaxID=378194 RepID=UPI002008667B|nr:uncharacterized protein BXZ73DRAFT_88458 [Epithele typhae]KAH9941320.1 hypothetical protein BXZ73DRAFT_88458 [Epithele typhae]